jgi:acetyl esterase/lipase
VINLAGLPPTFIGVGALDLFVEEDLVYAQRLISAGVPTEMHVVLGAPHGFDGFVPDASITRHFNKLKIDAFRRAFGNSDERSSAPMG